MGVVQLSTVDRMHRVTTLEGKRMESTSQSLWNKNYTLIIIGTIISAIGGVGLSLALSVTVYDNTQSTWLTGLYGAISILPGLLIPVLVSPFIDRFSRQKIIVALDTGMGFLMLLFAWLTYVSGFNYYFYVVIGLVISLNSIVYELAYSSLFPNLIPKGKFQQGYAIGNLIYPLTNVAVLPLATLVFHKFGVSFLFAAEGVLLISASIFERFIDQDISDVPQEQRSLKRHVADIRAGLHYLMNEKGIWNVYLFFVIMMFVDGMRVLIYPFFEQSNHLNVINYSLLLSFQSAGYMFGGIIHYFFKIPTKARFGISLGVYFAFAVLDAFFFFYSFPLMLGSKFLLGILGMNSANIRVTSINSYIDDSMRGRLNAVYMTMVLGAQMLGQLSVGWLAERLPIPYVALICGGLNMAGIFFFVIRNAGVIRPLYNRTV